MHVVRRRLDQRSNALGMFREYCAIEDPIREENSIRVLCKLGEDSLRLRLCGFSDEQCLHFEPASDGFLDQTNAFNSAESINRLALTEGLPEILYQCVLGAGNGSQAG